MSSLVPAPLPTRRADLLAALREDKTWDLAVIGGGATGLGVALDAAMRGFSVVLLESRDFAAGTSSRATKLVHGGVRYLAQGNVPLVAEALHERTRLLHNAPHLARALPFVMPSYAWWEMPFYGVGLKVYDLLAGRHGLGRTEFLSRHEVLRCLPGVCPDGLLGGVKYWDGQFDDARMALALARTAAAEGALVLNHCAVKGLVHENGKVAGLTCCDAETAAVFEVRARCVINATGVWVDALRHLDGEALGLAARPVVAPSQGVHLVVDGDFLPGNHALLVPKTKDGRVLFAVPWQGKLILGTTDTPRHDLALEPEPFGHEVDFILNESARYLRRAPRRGDVRSCWVGLRPLVKADGADADDTKALSREHTVLVSSSGMVTVTGGKWTTYRAMAEDVLHRCMVERLLPRRAAGDTRQRLLVGAPDSAPTPQAPDGLLDLSRYGTEAAAVRGLPGSGRILGGGLSEAMVRFAVRHEYARTVEDVLARRIRLLFLDARLAARLASKVGAIIAEETGADPEIQAFEALAVQYSHLPR